MKGKQSMQRFISKFLLLLFVFLFIFTSVEVYALDKKFEYIEKYDYSYRLKMFEEDIVNYYKGLNCKKILVVGDTNFASTFKDVFSKERDIQIDFMENIYCMKCDKGRYDLIIDTKHEPVFFDKIYEGKNVSSFRDVYTQILCKKTLEFLKKNEISYYFFEAPDAYKIKNLDEFEKHLLSSGKTSMEVVEDKELREKLYSDNKDCLKKVSKYFDPGNIYLGLYYLKRDYKSEFENVVAGKRVTVGQPDTYKFSINFIGPCLAYGNFVSDAYTIPSYFQKIVNNDFQNQFIVNNYGVNPLNVMNEFEIILNSSYKKGDIVIHLGKLDAQTESLVRKECCGYFETTHLFNRPHNYGYWMINDGFHINHNGNLVISEYIFKTIEQKLIDNQNIKNNKEIIEYKINKNFVRDSFLESNPEFLKYLEQLNKIKNDREKNLKPNSKIGAVVVNCNPFTFGHRYLIEKAKSNVDFLYIFVVEEDKSIFPFKDRIELVRKGTSNMENVEVLPSGKWMISIETFPEYFKKDQLLNEVVDPSKDVKIFGKYICPTLGINTRFVGEEPFDNVTKQYNDTLKRELTKFGVDLIEIQRKEIDGNVISASLVRKLASQNKFDDIKKYVPLTTLEYLKNNFTA